MQNWLFLDCNLWNFKHSDVISVQLHIKLVFCGNIVTKKGDNICEISSIHLRHHLFFHHFFHLLRWFTQKATISGEKIVTLFGNNIVTKNGDNNCDRNFTIFSDHQKYHLFLHQYCHHFRWFTWKITIFGEKIVTFSV